MLLNTKYSFGQFQEEILCFQPENLQQGYNLPHKNTDSPLTQN